MTTRLTILAIALSMINLAALSQVTIPQSVNDENPRARAEYEFNRLKDPKSGTIPDRMREKELDFARALPKSKKSPRLGNSTQSTEALSWTGRGPVNVGGRTRALGVDVANQNIMLAGGVSGGLWRSSDAGATWTIVSGLSELHSISCIVQDTRAGHTDTWY